MEKKYDFLRRSLSVLLLCWLTMHVGLAQSYRIGAAHPSVDPGNFKAKAQLNAKVDKPMYGWCLYDSNMPEYTGLVSFNTSDLSKVTPITEPGPAQYACAGCFIDEDLDGKGEYYLFGMKEVAGAEPVLANMMRVDLQTGKTTHVTEYEGVNGMFHDVEYDYSTGKMYAIYASGESAMMFVIDPATGKFEQVGTVFAPLFTLAINFQGEMYGVGLNGYLYRVNKEDWTVQKIGPTGAYPRFSQSMAFDHSDNTLYWTYFNNGIGKLMTVNTQTAVTTDLGNVGGNTQIVGLYIPFKLQIKQPRRVTDFVVTAGALGEEKADLSWKNPSENLDGSAIGTLSKIEIYRDGEFIDRVSNPQKGAIQTWQDKNVRKGMHMYTVIACTDVKGMSASQSLYIGKDVPNSPRNVSLTSNGTTAVLNWEPVIEGYNGGWFDKHSLKYKITRLPDKKVVGETSDNTFTDAAISLLNVYTYIVESYNADGTGGNTMSNSLAIGPSLELPYTCNFSTVESFLLWNVMDINKDGYSWAWNSYEKIACCREPVGKNSDDYMFSPPLKLEANRKYRISYTMSSFIPGVAENVKITIGKGASQDKQTTVLADYPELDDLERKNYIVEFTPSESGDYYLGIYCYSVSGYMVCITEVDVRAYEQHNLVGVKLQGQTCPIVGKQYDYELKIKNMGLDTESKYTVDVLNEKGIVLKTLANVPAVPMNEEKSFIFNWGPETEEAASSILCRMNVPGAASSNVSPSLNVSIQPAGSAEYVEIGSGQRYDTAVPISTSTMYSGSQALYLKDEIKGLSGLIEKISYNLASSEGAENVAIEVYMANTAQTSLGQTGMLPKELFTKVFDGTVIIPSSDQATKWEIKLDDKFLYLGENLLIMVASSTKKMHSTSFLIYDDWKVSFQRTSSYFSNEKPFEYSSDQVLLFIPQINLHIQQNGGAVMTGVITESGNPVAGAMVSVDALKATKLTDENGRYEFPYLFPGTYEVTVSKFGYETKTVTEANLVAGKSNAIDMDIQKLAVRKVSGVCCDGNKVPVAGATVKLLGYDNYNAISGEDGTFTFDRVYAVEEPYQIEVKKLCYLNYRANVAVRNEDVKLELKLSEVPYLPSPVTATVEADAAKIKWDGIARETAFRIDDGNVSGQIGAVSDQYTVYGTAFRTPAILNELSWYVTSEGGPHETVNLFVFDLDEDGMPTNKILYHAEYVPNEDDQWSNFTLETPVECPNGFLLGISYEGFLGLGLDSGKDKNHPFKENTNFTCWNYTYSMFETLERSTEFKQNMMLRAKGIVAGSPIEFGKTEENMKRIPGSSVHYKVWRCLEENMNDESKWTLLTAEKISTPEYTDNSWKSLPAGAYVYAVKSIYPGEELSGVAFSNLLPKNMNANVEIKVTTHTIVNESEGAIVALVNNDKNTSHCYQQEVNSEGIASFEGIWKGTYSISIKHNGFHTLKLSDVEITGNQRTLSYELNERIMNPYNLEIDDEGDEVVFSWNNPFALEDSFEEHENFAVNSVGSFGWKYVDNDGCNTVVMGPATYPNIGSKMAGMIFNPKATTPALEMWEIQPYKGDKYLGIFTSENAANDDWIISPELNFPTDFVFEFYAKSMTIEFNLERMKIAYSTKGNQPSDFVNWVHEGDYVEPGAEKWAKYTYKIPADAKYVAIHCISENGFILMIDNVFIGMKEPEIVRPSVKYEIYLDSNLKTEVTDTRYVFGELPNGTYKAGVKAIYNSGQTDLIEKEFTVTASSIDEISISDITIYPNPLESVMHIKGEYDYLEILDISGQCIRSIPEAKEEVNVSDLLPGYYLVRLYQDGKVLVKKVIKK